MDNYVIADFTKDSEVQTEPLYQWDYGQKIMIRGVTDSVTEVHFFQKGYDRKAARVMPQSVTSADGDFLTVGIPNDFLKVSGNIEAYIYLTDENAGKTVKKATIYVKPRPEPDDYTSADETEEVNNAYQAVIQAKTDVDEAVGRFTNADTVTEMQSTDLVYIERGGEIMKIAFSDFVSAITNGGTP